MLDGICPKGLQYSAILIFTIAMIFRNLNQENCTISNAQVFSNLVE